MSKAEMIERVLQALTDAIRHALRYACTPEVMVVVGQQKPIT